MTKQLWFLALSVLLIPVSAARANEVLAYEVVADGTTYQANFTEANRNIKDFTVYFVSEGNNTTSVAVNLQGPVGAQAKARIGLMGGDGSAAAAKDPSFGAEARFRTSQSKKEFAQAVIAGDTSSSATSSVYSWFHLHKDACSGSKATKYLAKVTVDVSKVDQALFANGFTLLVSLQEYRFKGAQVASIKPASDGKYFGEPILLMGTVSYGNEYVNIRTHARGGRLRAQRRIPIVKYVGYRGYGLSLARLRGLLNGGKATFELSNGGDIYGVCFSLVRKRQVRNGYPMSAE